MRSYNDTSDEGKSRNCAYSLEVEISMKIDLQELY